jgi:hypothetical protein
LQNVGPVTVNCVTVTELAILFIGTSLDATVLGVITVSIAAEQLYSTVN